MLGTAAQALREVLWDRILPQIRLQRSHLTLTTAILDPIDSSTEVFS